MVMRCACRPRSETWANASATAAVQASGVRPKTTPPPSATGPGTGGARIGVSTTTGRAGAPAVSDAAARSLAAKSPRRRSKGMRNLGETKPGLR